MAHPVDKMMSSFARGPPKREQKSDGAIIYDVMVSKKIYFAIIVVIAGLSMGHIFLSYPIP